MILGGIYLERSSKRFFQVIDMDFHSDNTTNYLVITYPSETYKWARLLTSSYINENIDNPNTNVQNIVAKEFRKINNKCAIKLSGEILKLLQLNSSYISNEEFLDIYNGVNNNYEDIIRKCTITKDILSIKSPKIYTFIPKDKGARDINKCRISFNRVELNNYPKLINFIKVKAILIEDHFKELYS